MSVRTIIERLHTAGFLARTLMLATSLATVACETTPAVPQGGMSGLRSTADNRGTDANAVFELTSRADLAYRESRWIDAARDYHALTKNVPRDAYAWFRLGNTYAKQGEYDEAIHAYETSISHDAEQPKPWFNLSTAYLLSAQAAMSRARDRLRADDPARTLIEERLQSLGSIMHGRFEDSASPTAAR